MNILVLNYGSSSIKGALYDFNKEPIKTWDSNVNWKNNSKSPKEAIEHLLQQLSSKNIDAIGHRIVHGGRYFHEATLITQSIKDKINELSELAPLHNKVELQGIEICEKLFKKVPQIAVFDTSFHKTMPDSAKIYPVPYKWYEEGIQRFGFHGISFQYCSKRAETLLRKMPAKMVICHLGSGASLCALKGGVSVDTTMGYTPLDGLMMDTRSGSIDPGIIFHLLKKGANADDLLKELYSKSGLLGVSGLSSDMSDIIESKDLRAKIAFDVYIHRLNALIGSMIASLQGLDVLVFTAGIGENSSQVRKKVCDNFSFLDLNLDVEKNNHESKEDRELTGKSKVKVLLIHTQEAYEIASQCWKKLSKN